MMMVMMMLLLLLLLLALLEGAWFGEVAKVWERMHTYKWTDTFGTQLFSSLGKKIMFDKPASQIFKATFYCLNAQHVSQKQSRRSRFKNKSIRLVHSTGFYLSVQGGVCEQDSVLINNTRKQLGSEVKFQIEIFFSLRDEGRKIQRQFLFPFGSGGFGRSYAATSQKKVIQRRQN